MAVASNHPYAAGQIGLFPPGGGGVTFGGSHSFDAVFDVGLGLCNPTNGPAYASTPVVSPSNVISFGSTFTITSSVTRRPAHIVSMADRRRQRRHTDEHSRRDRSVFDQLAALHRHMPIRFRGLEQFRQLHQRHRLVRLMVFIEVVPHRPLLVLVEQCLGADAPDGRLVLGVGDVSRPRFLP